VLAYKTDNFYHAQSDAGIHPHDPDLNIPWPIAIKDHQLSGKDKQLPLLRDVTNDH